MFESLLLRCSDSGCLCAINILKGIEYCCYMDVFWYSFRKILSLCCLCKGHCLIRPVLVSSSLHIDIFLQFDKAFISRNYYSLLLT